MAEKKKITVALVAGPYDGLTKQMSSRPGYIVWVSASGRFSREARRNSQPYRLRATSKRRVEMWYAGGEKVCEVCNSYHRPSPDGTVGEDCRVCGGKLVRV